MPGLGRCELLVHQLVEGLEQLAIVWVCCVVKHLGDVPFLRLSLFGVQAQQDIVLGPIFGNPNDHVSVLLLQVLDSERGLLSLMVALVLHVLAGFLFFFGQSRGQVVHSIQSICVSDRNFCHLG